MRAQLYIAQSHHVISRADIDTLKTVGVLDMSMYYVYIIHILYYWP